MSNSIDRAVVTGGCGFIGSHIAEHLAASGSEVIVIDNLAGGKTDNLSGLNGSIIHHNVDICSELAKYMEDADIIFHLAANVSVMRSLEDPAYDSEVNVNGTLNVLETARLLDIPQFVYSSSCAVYGDPDTIPTPETQPLSPISPYGVSKSIGEEYCKLYSRLYGMGTVSLRYFNVYGSRQSADSPYSGVIAIFLNKALKGEQVTIYGDGGQSRDFISVNDVVSANMKAAERKLNGEAFNIGTGVSTTLNQLADHIGAISGGLDRTYAGARAGEIRDSRADVKRAEEGLEFRSAVTIEQGLKDLYGSMRE